MKDYLIIDRSKWRTGGDFSNNATGKGDTHLLNKQGFMCCLGFRCNQMGIPKKDLLDQPTPEHLAESYDIPDLIKGDDYDGWQDTKFTNEAIRINDDNCITSKEREKAIKEHFATIGVTVQFKGEYVKS